VNFAEGRPRFAVMVAYVHLGNILAGWIHDPINRRNAVAEQGSGAFLDGERLSVAPAPQSAREMTGTLHTGKLANPVLRQRVQERRGLLNAVKSLRCAGLEYIRLAAGEMHFSLFTNLLPWDHAPGVLLHAEAGGFAAYLEGGPYDPARITASGMLIAPDPASWRALHRLLLAPEDGR
jgi:fructose-1,6-bisphosphatase/inositol monophosphatase family enzyme